MKLFLFLFLLSIHLLTVTHAFGQELIDQYNPNVCTSSPCDVLAADQVQIEHGQHSDVVRWAIADNSQRELGMSLNTKTGLFTWTPTNNQAGNFTIQVVGLDVNGTEIVSSDISITVETNDQIDWTNVLFVVPAEYAPNRNRDMTGAQEFPYSYDAFGSLFCKDDNGDPITTSKTVFFRGGLHTTDIGDNPAAIFCSGESLERPFTLSAWGNERPVLSPKGTEAIKIQGDFVTLSGFEIAGYIEQINLAQAVADWWWEERPATPEGYIITAQGILAKGRGIVIQNNLVHSWPGNAVKIEGDLSSMLDNVVFNSGYYSTRGVGGVMVEGLNDSELAMPADRDFGIIIKNNVVFGNESRIISHVFSKDFSTLEIDEGSALNLQQNGGDYTRGYLVENNAFLYNGKGVGLRAKNIVFRNNTVYGNGLNIRAPGASGVRATKITTGSLASVFNGDAGSIATVNNNIIAVPPNQEAISIDKVSRISGGCSNNLIQGIVDDDNQDCGLSENVVMINDPVLDASNINFSPLLGSAGAKQSLITDTIAKLASYGHELKPSGFNIMSIHDYDEYVLPMINEILRTTPEGDVGVELTFEDANGSVVTTVNLDDNNYEDLLDVATIKFNWLGTKPKYDSKNRFAGSYEQYIKAAPDPYYSVIATVSPVGSGYVTCSDISIRSTKNQRQVSCEAVPLDGYTFTSWSGDCSGDTCDIASVNGDVSLIAVFDSKLSETDTDNDGIPDIRDDDDDNDGVIDSLDIFPLDNSEQTDTDDDGLGDNYEIVNGLDRKNPDFDSDGLKDGAEIELGTDPKLADSDDDGVIDGKDKFPLISIGDLLDTDFDGAPDACDEACIELGMLADNDDDNDGIDDRTDVHPLIAIVDLVDTDSDGAPDTCDSVCVELGMVADTDDDNDGVLDTADAYPLISIGDLTDTDSDGAPDTCDEACVEHGMQEDKGYGIDYGRGTPIYIRGSMNAWGMNDYLLNQGNELFTTSISLNEGSYEFYIASEDWSSLFLGPDDDSDKARNVIVGDSYTLSNQLTSSTPPFKMEVAEDTHYLFIFNNLEGNPSLTTFAVSDQGAIHPNVQNDIANIIDKDNDGVLNQFDFFPLISIGELVDTDSDGAPDTCDEACIELGMAADVDDDNDGVLDTADAYPLAAIGGLVDTDLDGAPDTCDEACVELGMAADNDDDNDGIVDTSDAYPLISIGDLVDTDSDGAPDTCDEACVELGMTADTDIDGDGVTNNLDAFPNDSSEFIDTDLDGIGNRKDYDDDNDQINDNVIYLAFNTTNNISGEFSNNSDVTDILTTPDLIKGWLKINKALIPRSTTDTTYINPVIAYGIQIGSYQIGPFENNSENYNEIRVIYDGKALDLYIWPNYTNELNEEQVEKISFRIDLPSDFNYEPGQSLVDVGELFERTNKINNSNSLSIWWPSGRTGNLDVDYFYDKARSTRLSDTYPLISIGDLVDTDSDGAPDTCNEACGELGMVADSDDDNDGVLDTADTYPLIAIGSLTDTDSDGAPDTCDSSCIELGMTADSDDDNDGVLDTADAYPLVAIGSLTDTDSDGAPDTCAESCLELGMLADTDDDNDGVLDVTEIELGTDPKLSDTDGDGVNDNEDDSTVIISSIFPSLNVTVIGPFNDISRGSFRLTSSANPNMLVIYPISITGNKMEFEYKFPSNAVSSEYKISTVAMVRENDEVVQEYNNYYFDLINENEEVSEFSIQDPHVSYDGKLGLVNVRFIVDGLIDGITRVWPIGTRESLNMDLGFIDGSAQRLKGRVLNREVLDGINGTNVLNFNYFIADELLPETIYVRSIALTDKALNGVYHTVDTDEDRIIDALDVYPLIPLGEYIDTNKNGAPEQCDESCAALGMSTEDIFNPKYYRLEQSTFEFASLTPTAKVIVTGSQGNNFFDIARYVNDVSLVGQTFLVSGSGNVDGFMVMPGVKYDLTNLKGSVDGIYFSGPFAEYADSILLDPSSGVMQLSRLTDIGEEIVQFIATASAADVLVFTDGAISTSAIKDAIINETPMGDLVLDTSVSALDTKPTTGATVKHIVLDNNGAGVMALGPNISTLISGSSGMDHIYVPAGSVVDASNLKSGQDEIYLEGALTDYSLTLDNSGNITLTRDITVNDENVTEQVTVASGGNVATNDLVIFADQQLQTQVLKQQYLN